MVNVMEFYAIDELDLLWELSEDLEGSLLHIAHAGGSENPGMIRGIQKSLRDKYGARIDQCDLLKERAPAGTGILLAARRIYIAFSGLQDILFYNQKEDCPTFEEKTKRIEEESLDLLYENLIFPDDFQSC
jgi:hypothetical protein